ncbi:MAG: EAL domain-containing protein [Gammaproteobacteria bacterium]|nr:EAL domain-containing protein [Gammaproteobacteria bacterium]
MSTPRPRYPLDNQNLEDLIRKSDILNLVDATVAIVNVRGELVFQNDAFVRFNGSVRDSVQHFNEYSTLLECPAMQQAIDAVLAGGKESLLKQVFYYGPQIQVDLSLRIRPLDNNDTGKVVGATIQLGEESVAFENSHLARLQESLRTLTERVRALSAEKISDSRLIRILFKESPIAMILLNEKRQVLQINRAGERLFGVSERELMGQGCDMLLQHPQFPPGDPSRHEQSLDGLREITGMSADKQPVPLLRSSVMFDDHNGNLILEILIDLTERRKSEDLLARLGRILDESTNEIYVFDADTLHFVQVNDGGLRNLGYSAEELKTLTPLDLKPDFTKQSFESLIAPLRRGETQALVFETFHKRKNGQLYPVEVRLQLSQTESPPVFVAIIQDITERRESEKYLHHLAHHDSLTNLPNRVLLQQRLNQALLDADQLERLVAVMFLDLDHFKTINDTLGHDIGDALLKSVAERLAKCLRPGDIVSRLGGDEFTIGLINVAHVDDVTQVAQKILDQFISPFRIGGRILFITPSIGITLYPLDEKDTPNLLRDADIAMYRAKELGRNQYQFYTPELNVRATRRLELETGLRQALERQELVLHYQPLVDMKTGRIRGMEALLRWQHPKFGLIPPLDFIPLAEDTGLIVPIGEWVLKTACAQIKAWHDAGFRGLQVAVNLSSKQLRDNNLVNVVEQAVKEAGIDPDCLDLEITESVLMHDMDLASTILKELKKVGVLFSLDDFGTGYSSLSYLKRFPIDYLKIDRSFINDIITDPVGAGLVKAIIAMANVLNIQVIAEGVESHEQLEFLSRHGCDITQGYFCSPPIATDMFTDLLRDWAQIRADKCSIKDW